MSKLGDLIHGEHVSLPSEDSDPERRAEQLKDAQTHYAYAYDKPNLRNIAMCADLAKKEHPSAAWLAEAALVAAGITINTAEQNKAEDEHGNIKALLEASGHKAPAELIERVQSITKSEVTGRAVQVADHARLLQHFRVPDIAAEIHLDDTFARMRVAGPNPAWMERVEGRLPDDLGLTAAHYRAAMGDGDSLEAALAEGRLFLNAYRELVDVSPGSHPIPDGIDIDYATDPKGWDAAYAQREAAYASTGEAKVLAAPLAVFALPKGGRSLRPVGIQLFPNGTHGGDHPVFTPRDGTAWLGAKTAVQMADGNVHQTISHLGLTHLVQEAFCLAMHNCLAPRHPLHRLLAPHFEGTLLINHAADASLVRPGSSVDTLLGPTIGGVIGISARARTAFDFNASMFPNDLERRGVADPEALPDYPYRDDGLLVWKAIQDWVRDYVEHYYPTNAVVMADAELQNFVLQVGQYKETLPDGRVVGGGVKNVGEDGPQVRTVGYLVQMITQIIWNGSAQHAAVNFPQGDLMIYTPAFPLYTAGPGPKSLDFHHHDYMQQLQHLDYAAVQVNIAALLGQLRVTKLGHYPSRLIGHWFPDSTIRQYNTVFQNDLTRIEEVIEQRNRRRPSYEYLKPSLIPMSIDI